LDLATESNFGRSFGGQNLLFSNRHFVWFTGDKLDTASRAASFATASVQLISARFFAKRSSESFTGGNFERSDSFNSEIWHMTLDSMVEQKST
jgi:hypothetical protein